MFNSYIAGLLLSFSALAIAGFVLLNNHRRSQNIIFFTIGLCSSIFTTFIFLSFIFYEDSVLTTIFNRFSVAFVILQAACLFYFSLIFPAERIRKKIFMWFIICLPALIIAGMAIGTDLFVKYMEVKPVEDFLMMFRQEGVLYTKVYAPMFGLYLLGSLIVFVFQYIKSNTYTEKKQIRYAALATVGGGLITSVTCIVLPSLGIKKYYVFGPAIALPFFVAIMAYNIITLKAMDIEQLISKSFLWLTTFLILLAPVSLFTYVLLRFSVDFTIVSGTGLMLLCISIILVYLKYVQPIIDEKFQKKVYDYNKIVANFNDQLTKLKSLDDLVESITSLIQKTIYSSEVNVLLMTEKNLEYRNYRNNIKDRANLVNLEQKHVDLIIKNEGVLEKEHLELDSEYDSEFRKIAIQYLNLFNCDVVIPIIFENKLIGSINIGPRMEKYYKRIELNFIDNLKSGINVAFSNSILLQQIKKLNESYARFVPKEILSYLGFDSIVEVGLGDNIEKDMTVFFSDIRSFTSLSESMTPKENFNFLNSYLSRIGPIIARKDGFIDKYIGDAVMALFPGEPEDALRAAIDIHHELVRYNIQRGRQGYVPISIGVGIHTGSLMLGTIGEKNRMDGTVISDSVNLASRIEGLTKVYGSKIILTEDTFSLIGDMDAYNYRFLGNVQVKGKKDSVKIYEVFDGDDAEMIDRKNSTKDLFQMGIMHYFNEDFSEASSVFKKVIDSGLNCAASKYYINRSDFFSREGIPHELTGVEYMDYK